MALRKHSRLLLLRRVFCLLCPGSGAIPVCVKSGNWRFGVDFCPHDQFWPKCHNFPTHTFEGQLSNATPIPIFIIILANSHDGYRLALHILPDRVLYGLRLKILPRLYGL